jgi:hypothetical protein
MSSKPRIILWDIETVQNLAAVFRLTQNDYIQPSNIVQERYIVTASWKELGSDKVHSVSILDDPKRFKKDHHDDLYVCKTLHDVLSGADVIIAHNGDMYDIKFTEGRFLIHDLEPLPPITKIDTLKAARDRFLLNANNLDYLAQLLRVGKKVKTDAELWLRVLRGQQAAIKEMLAYNKKDVLLLEKVFLKLQPYIANHVNRQLFGGDGCPRCGSTKIQSRGVHRAVTQIYNRFQCQSCFGWFRTTKADRSRSVKTRVL